MPRSKAREIEELQDLCNRRDHLNLRLITIQGVIGCKLRSMRDHGAQH